MGPRKPKQLMHVSRDAAQGYRPLINSLNCTASHGWGTLDWVSRSMRILSPNMPQQHIFESTVQPTNHPTSDGYHLCYYYCWCVGYVNHHHSPTIHRQTQSSPWPNPSAENVPRRTLRRWNPPGVTWLSSCTRPSILCFPHTAINIRNKRRFGIIT